MKTINIPDELYERLKNCVVDPFDDTPESVISRLIDITDKAKSSWSPLDAHVKSTEQSAEPQQDGQPAQQEHWRKQAEPVL
jgi:predicted CopG family antitoxin